MKLKKKIFLLVLVIIAAILFLPGLLAYDGNIESPALPIFIDTNYTWVWNFIDADYNSELDYVYSIGYNDTNSFDGSETYFINNELDNNVTDRDEGLLQWVFDPRELTQTGDRAGDSNRPVQEGKSYNFDGVDDLVDTGTDMIGTKAVTVMGWIKPYGWGEGTVGRILDNGKFYFYISGGSTRLTLKSDDSTGTTSAIGSISLNQWKFVSITREADGTANFYIGDLDTAPALSGSADQNSGVPVAGITNVIIGNNNGTSRSFDGEMFDIRVYEGILDLNQITEVYNHGQPENNDPTIDLLAQYKMDEDSGTTAYDSSGNGYDGTITNANGLNWNQDTLQTSNLVNDGTIPYTTFISNGRYGFSATSDASGNKVAGTVDQISIVDTKKYLVEFDLTLNSGTAPTFGLRETLISGPSSNSTTAINGINSYILTATATTRGVLYFQNSSTTTDYTISNLIIIEVPFFNTQPIFSWQNQYGYSEDGNVFIPRDESNPTKDVLGSDLNYTGRVKYDIELSNSYAGTVWDDSNITFLDNTDWNYMTYEGTAVADLNIDNNAITFLDTPGQGTIYNIKIYDSVDTLLTWLPVAEGTGNTLFDVTGNKNHAQINFGSYVDYSTDFVEDYNFEEWSTIDSIINSDTNFESTAVDGRIYGSYSDWIKEDNIGKDYLITLNFLISSGTITIRPGGASAWSDNTFSESGSYITTINNNINTNIVLELSDANESVDITNFTIYEIPDSNSDIFWNTSTQDTFHYNFEDGFYQDGSALFDGADSKVDTGTDMIGTKAVTIMGWINPYSFGENGVGAILYNDKIIFRINLLKYLQFSSDGGNTFVVSGGNSISLNQWKFVSITREADGTANFYIGDLDTAPALSGSADQNSGTPVDGTTNVIIGNNNDQIRTFDGEIRHLKVVEGILTPTDIQQEWQYNNWDTNLLAYYPLISDSNDLSGNDYNGTDTSMTYIPQKIPAEYTQDYDSWLERTLTNLSGNYHNNAETNLAQPLAPALIQADVNSWWFTYSTDTNYYYQNDVNYDSLVFNIGDYNYTFLVDDTNNQKQNMRYYSDLLSQDEQDRLTNLDYLDYNQITWKQFSQDFNTHDLNYNTAYYSFFNLDWYDNANSRQTSTYWSDDIFIMYTTSNTITNPSETIYTYKDYNWICNVQDELYDENRVYRMSFGFNYTDSFDGNEEYVFANTIIPVDSNNYDYNLATGFEFSDVGKHLYSFVTTKLYVDGYLSDTNTSWSSSSFPVYNNLEGVLTNPQPILYAYQNYVWGYSWDFTVVDHTYDENRSYDWNFGINNVAILDGNQHAILIDQNLDMNLAAPVGFDINTDIDGNYVNNNWYSYVSIALYDENVYVDTTSMWSADMFELRLIRCLLPTNSCDDGDLIVQAGFCTYQVLLPNGSDDVQVTVIGGGIESARNQTFYVNEDQFNIKVWVDRKTMPVYLTCAIDVNGERYILDHISLGLGDNYYATEDYYNITNENDLIKWIFGLIPLLFGTFIFFWILFKKDYEWI